MTERMNTPLLKTSVDGPYRVYTSDSDISSDELVVNTPGPASLTTNTKQTSNRYVYLLSFTAALGGFLFGYDTGVVSGAMLELRDVFFLSSVWQELIISVTIGFAAIFAIIAGILNDTIGRRLTIMISSVIFTVGAILLGAAPNKETLLIGRMIVGAGIGLASMSVPMYVAEAAPADLRGRLVTLVNAFVTAGQFIASIIDGIFSYDRKNGWRFMLGLAAIPSVLQFVGFFFLPESPRFLVQRKRDTEAEHVLAKLRNGDVEEELSSIRAVCSEETKHSVWVVFCRVAATPAVRKALFVGCSLQMFQQITGINTVMYYSATIIRMGGVRDKTTAIWLACITAFANFFFNMVGLLLVEKIGRKTLILSSLIGTMVSLCLLAVSFQVSAFHSPKVNQVETVPIGHDFPQCSNYSTCNDCISNTNCGYCYNLTDKQNTSCTSVYTDAHQSKHTDWSAYGRCSRNETRDLYAYDYCPTSLAWISIAGLVMYLAFFAPGMGPMPWTINSEIYPNWARSLCISLATMTNWVFNLLISMTFLTLTETITRYGAFWLYSSFAAVGILFIVKFLPETKGVTLENVETLFA